MNPGFKKSIDERTYCVGIIGLGYVGLPLVMEFAKSGFKTIGFDIDQSKVDLLIARETYLKHISKKSVEALNDTGNFVPTTDYRHISDTDAIIICVPTPLTLQREPELKYITKTAEMITPYLKKGHLVILESTTYPGTTDEVLLPILEKSGLKCGVDFQIAFSPEREDPGNKDYNTGTIPKVVGGNTPEATEMTVYLFKQAIVQVVAVSSTQTAEAVKLTENIFRSVNIALVNELKIIYSRMGIDIWEVINAAKTKPFGFMAFYPGPGLGGHCIPIDPFYLTWKAREFETATRFIETAGEINTAMPMYVVQELMNALNGQEKALKNSKVLLMGLAYKKDIDDLRESPSLKLLEILTDKGALVDYHDPMIPKLGPTRDYRKFAGMESVELTPERISGYDAVLISTDHTAVDYEKLVKNAKLVVDTRNATKDVTIGREKIVKA